MKKITRVNVDCLIKYYHIHSNFIMPKLTSTSRSKAIIKDKENEAPTMAHYAKKRKDDYEDEEEEVTHKDV